MHIGGNVAYPCLFRSTFQVMTSVQSPVPRGSRYRPGSPRLRLQRREDEADAGRRRLGSITRSHRT